MTTDASTAPGVMTVMQVQSWADGAQLCALGYHAWVPWLANPNGLSWWTYCVRCRHQEQFDL